MAKVVTILAAALMISTASTCQAEPLTPGNYCEHLGNTWQGFKCAWKAQRSVDLMRRADHDEVEANFARNENDKVWYKNSAAMRRLKAEQYAEEYRRTYAPK